MKKNLLKGIVLVLAAAFFFSCEALPIDFPASQAFLIYGSESENYWTTLTLSDVQIDRIGGWDSIEKEVRSLAPLYFWKNGCKVVPACERAYYSAQVQIREREFSRGWRNKRSLAVEVRIWTYDEAPENEEPLQNYRLPVSVSRVVLTGEKSFYSSQTMSRLLSKAVKEASEKLAEYNKGKENA